MKILLLFIVFSQYAFSQNSLMAKYPNGLLINDYGVLTEKHFVAGNALKQKNFYSTSKEKLLFLPG